MSKTANCTQEVMLVCKFASDNKNRSNYCDYIGIVGHMRGCDPSKCDKFEKKTEKRPKVKLNPKRGKKNET